MIDKGKPHNAHDDEPHDDSLDEKAGQYLTFLIGNNEYGIEILKVQEFVGLMPIKRVPDTPPFIRGIVNLHGQNIPVMDLRVRFLLESREDTDRTSIVVVRGTCKGKEIALGFLVDDVREVMEITEEQLEPPPTTESASDDSFIMATARVDGKTVMLLNIDKILESSNASSVM